MSFCISASPEARELAERTALITLAMCEALANHPQSSLPGGYRYHIYGGFPGFADHAAEASLELHHALEPYGIECIIDIALDYASAVIDADVRLGSPVPPATLTALSADARRKAISTGIAVLRKSAKYHFCNWADAQGPTCTQTDFMDDLQAECEDWRPVTNDERARWAHGAIEAFCAATGSDIDDGAFQDLLCDLGHYADRHGLDFRHEINRALETWLDECKDEQCAAAAGNP